MRSFEEIYPIVELSSSEAAFNRAECEAMYKYLSKMKRGDQVVELGIQFGRSTSVIAEVQKDRGFSFTAVDNWLEDVSGEARKHIYGKGLSHDWNVHFVESDSAPFATHFKPEVSLIHIDADHTFEGVTKDIEAWLPKVESGGYALFDDYGHDSLPGVYQACQAYFPDHPEWKFINRYGDKLGVFQRK